MVLRLGEGHMPGTFFLSEPQLKTTVDYSHFINTKIDFKVFVTKEIFTLNIFLSFSLLRYTV